MVVDEEIVVEIAADRSRGLHAAADGDVGTIRKGRNALRHDGLLDALGDVELARQSDEPFVIVRRLALGARLYDAPAQCDREVLEVDRLGDEVERPAIEGRADVRHVAVGRDNHGFQQGMPLVQVGEQGQTVHHGHVDVGQHHVGIGLGVELPECILAIAREDEPHRPVPNLASKSLINKQF